jgi:transcriptional regulator with XRE-family HTH domain
MTNTSLLKEKIKRSGYKMSFLADMLDIDPSTLSRKLNNKAEFWESEMNILSKLLKMSKTEKNAIFFAN